MMAAGMELMTASNLGDREDDSHDSSNTHYEGVEYAGQGYYAGVLGVGGVGRAAEQTSQGGTDTVAQQGAGQTGISNEVLAAGSADSHNIANMLNHCSNGNRQEDQAS